MPIKNETMTDRLLQPLAARMRPRNLEEFAGQQHILSPQQALFQAILNGKLHSMVLWGPPGSGKTTLAHLISVYAETNFITLSAVLGGVKEIRAAVDEARYLLKQRQQPTILFVDEVHRFNKAQQDAFLPHVEDGTLTFIGATTENPSFALNNALLSRVRVYVLKALSPEALVHLLENALADHERGLGAESLQIGEELKKRLAQAADGDARRALNFLEVAAELAENRDDGKHISETVLQQVLASGNLRRFDKGGDVFYEQISALHKSVRGSSPDAALYWLCRMLDGGCDPLYIARRIVRMASEDIGNADPRALRLALDAWEVQERLGSPEGELALAQAVIYLSCAAKSNAVYKAYNNAMRDAQQNGSQEVPLHLRNAPGKLMKELGYAKHYRYAHDEPQAYAANENYFPEGMPPGTYYAPVDRGLEIRIREKLTYLHSLDEQAASHREMEKKKN